MDGRQRQILPIGFQCSECLYICMKVEGPNRTSGPKGAAKADAKKSTGDSAFGSMVNEAGEAEAQAPVLRPAAVSALDALLVLQGAEGGVSEEATKKARKRAAELLEHLEKIRIGLLTGELPKATLQQLAQTISLHRETAIDPRLAEILEEIDLRAQVELAKLEMSREQ